jgi:hypothetical protein
MNKTAFKPQSQYGETGMKLISTGCMAIYILLLCIASPIHAKHIDLSALRSISWPEIDSMLSKRSFVSKEELFQLLHQLYSEQQDMIRLDRPVIQKLAGTIKSLFPLDACESITLKDGTVNMAFIQPQDIYIPKTWHQASLKIPKHLVLRLENVQKPNSPGGLIKPVENDTQSVRFIVEQGYLQLDFSFLLKIFGPNLRDAQGGELLYQISEKKQISSLSLIEVTPLTQHDLSVEKRQSNTQPDEYSWIDICHSDFPDTKDIGVSANKMSYLGMEIELLPEERIRFGKEEPRQDSEAYHYFRNSLGNFKDLVFSDGKPMTIDYTRTFGYQFEERKIVITIGFRSAKDKSSIM